jgi:DNA invertase Pin-like site-specific DNA recombinase
MIWFGILARIEGELMKLAYGRVAAKGQNPERQFFSMLAYVAEQESKKKRQRQAEGNEVAKADRGKFGRPKVEIDAAFVLTYDEWKAGTITAAMKKLNMKHRMF